MIVSWSCESNGIKTFINSDLLLYIFQFYTAGDGTKKGRKGGGGGERGKESSCVVENNMMDYSLCRPVY